MGCGTRFLVLINTAGRQDRLQLPPHRPVSTSDLWHCRQRPGNNTPCHLRHWEVTRLVRLLVATIIGYRSALLSGSEAHSVRCDHRTVPFDTRLAEVGTAEIPPVCRRDTVNITIVNMRVSDSGLFSFSFFFVLFI